MAARWFGSSIALPSCFKKTMREYKFKIFADNFQINLQDFESKMDLPLWNKEANENRFEISKSGNMITIGTARNMDVPVTVEIRNEAPPDDFDNWDHVNEGSLEVLSGYIWLFGWSDELDASPRIPVASGQYRVRIYYGNLDSLSKDGLEGDDHYKIVLWQAAQAPPQVLKRSIKTLSTKLIQ